MLACLIAFGQVSNLPPLPTVNTNVHQVFSMTMKPVITNIPVTLTYSVVTNFAERAANPNPSTVPMRFVSEPTEKWQSQTICLRTIGTMQFCGKPVSVTNDEMISSNELHLVQQVIWTTK